MRFGKNPSRPRPPPAPTPRGAGPREVPPDVQARFQKFREMLNGRPVLSSEQMAPQLATQMPTAQDGGGGVGGVIKGQPTTSLGERLRTNLSPMFGKGSLPTAGQQLANTRLPATKMKKGGQVKSSASKRADGCITKGRTKGKMI